MAFSELAKKIILEQLSNSTGPKDDKITYDINVGLIDAGKDGVSATMSFKFNKPVSQDLIEKATPAIFKIIEDNYDVDASIQDIGNIYAKMLGFSLSSNKKKNRETGAVNVNLGDPSDAEGFAGTIQGPSGRFISNSNLMSALELLAKAYLTRDMQASGAHLKWRTGRFANSMKVKDLLVRKQGPDTILDVSYNYMTRPYSVFNPAVSTYHRLSLHPFRGARNPQALIGAALSKAIKELVHSKYKIEIGEGT